MPLFAKASDGRIVRAKDTLEDTFTCSECGDRMSLVRSSSARGAHFRHVVAKGGETSCSGGESDIHKLAKMLIVEHLPNIVFKVKCECNMPTTIRFQGSVIAVEEQPYGTRKLDVGIVEANNKSNIVAGIEVHHTHLVDEEKQKDIIKLQWIEVEAEEIIRILSSNDTDLFRINATNSNLVDCITCQAWRTQSDELFEKSNGTQRIVRRLILTDVAGRHYQRLPIVEHIIRKGPSQGKFISDIQKVEPWRIPRMLSSVPPLRKEHMDTCLSLMFGMCHECGKFNPGSLADKRRTLCGRCFYHSIRG
jgi:hypothetical protein